MAWKEVSKMSSKYEFVRLAQEGRKPFSKLCVRFGISRKTGYKLLGRYEAEGVAGLEERSRRPLASPGKTSPEIEAFILSARQKKPYWGGRKIHAWLKNQGFEGLPAPSTITDILHRHGLIVEDPLAKGGKP